MRALLYLCLFILSLGGFTTSCASANSPAVRASQAAASNTDLARQWEDEIFYVIIPQKFFNGDKTNDIMLQRFGPTKDQYQGGFWGGDLAGIIQKMDYLSDLGVTTIFLNPIVQNDQYPFFGYLAPGYRPKDYFRVDENFGTTETAKSFVELAHTRGMRVVLDMPLALSGQENPYYTQQYRDKGWFTGGSAFGMPIWNADNPDTAAYLISVGRYWRDTIGCDGYRLDSANLLSNSFWKRFAGAMRDASHPGYFMMAEIGTDGLAKINPFLTTTTIDSGYDWGTLRLQNVFGKDALFSQINFLQSEAHSYYPNPLRMIGEVDNYEDTPFITISKDPKQDRMKLALACLLTLDRIPMLYTGDEAALNYSDVGALFEPQNQNPAFFNYVKQLIAVRKQEAALRRGAYQQVFYQEPIFAYTRTYSGEQILVILNNSSSTKTASFAVAGVAWKDMKLTDLMQKTVAKTNGQAAAISIPPYGAAILKISRDPSAVENPNWRNYK